MSENPAKGAGSNPLPGDRGRPWSGRPDTFVGAVTVLNARPCGTSDDCGAPFVLNSK